MGRHRRDGDRPPHVYPDPHGDIPWSACLNHGMGLYDQIKTAFQDIIAPELHALRGDMRLLDQKITGLDQKIDGVDARLTVKIDALRGEMGSLRGEMGSLRAEVVAEIRRVDTRIDGLDRELRTALDVRERLAALEARRPA